MPFHEHHFKSLERSRDALTNVIVGLRTAVEQMNCSDWIDAVELLNQLETDISPRLSQLRTSSRERFIEHTRLGDFEAMRVGHALFPDERAIAADPPARSSMPTTAPPPSNFPNAAIGHALVIQHGGVDEAMKTYAPDSAEFDHIQAYRYVTSGKRPPSWIPPVVSREE